MVNIQMMGNYNSEETPFDMFDTGCHDETITPYLENKEENITFMINVSEHVKRSQDMLMFLGEYFKELLTKTDEITQNLE